MNDDEFEWDDAKAGINQFNTEIRELNPGIYFVTVVTETEKYLKKIVKE